MIKRSVLLVAIVSLLVSCTSDNEHFCARYEYVYNQLLDPELPAISELRQRLEQDISQKKMVEKNQFMLFVLNEFELGIKPDYESAQEYCMRRKRWESYP